MKKKQQRITYRYCFAFGLNPNHWESGFGERRCEGYANALQFCDQVAIFCPENEFAKMKGAMIRHGADRERISWHETLHTTYYNAIEMRRLMATIDLKEHEVCFSSSWYHARAPFFAHELHDLNSTFIQAEAFTFAVCKEDALDRLTDAMCAEFGDGEGMRLMIKDIRGLGRRIAAKYQIPNQPT